MLRHYNIQQRKSHHHQLLPAAGGIVEVGGIRENLVIDAHDQADQPHQRDEQAHQPQPDQAHQPQPRRGEGRFIREFFSTLVC